MIEINMQMPEKCGLCPCFHHENPMYCQAVKADKNKKIVSPYGSQRPEWCPLKEQEEQIKNRDESLEKAREEIKWLRGMLKEQEEQIKKRDEQIKKRDESLEKAREEIHWLREMLKEQETIEGTIEETRG